MPELPEVETVVRQFVPLVVGRRLEQIELLDSKLALPPAWLRPERRVEAVERIGKQFVLRLGPQGPALAVHLRMTGRLKWHTEPGEPDPAHLRARFRFDEGQMLFYDVRRFGTLTVADELAQLAVEGLDPFDRRFSATWLSEQLQRTSQPIKSFLLRQDRLVGLGNIYCSEILFAAGVSPERASNTVTRREATRIHRHTRRILERAIENCGTTFSDFQDSRGEIGSYQAFLAVYGREGEPCPSCGTAIRRIVQQQRSTFFCSRCQR